MDNTHSASVFCRRDKLRCPLNARFLPTAAFRALRLAHALCYIRPSDIAVCVGDGNVSGSEKKLRNILL